MHSTARFIAFFIVFIGTWAGMNAYVLSRLWNLSVLQSQSAHRILLALFFLLWAVFPLAHILGHRSPSNLSWLLEIVGGFWMGFVFIALALFFFADVLTGFGWLFREYVPAVRWSALALTALFSVWGVVNGLRSPVIRRYEVPLAGLPASLDGTIAVQLSDLHLGTVLGERWLERLWSQVQGIRPDVVFMTGDIFDGNATHAEKLVPVLKKWQVPWGVWAVTGNHEYYAGLEESVAVLKSAGYQVLRDESVVVRPGLNLAGVDDLSARREFGETIAPIRQALARRDTGPTILLSHSPLRVEEAAREHVTLMLSGHTHSGQIWPFGHVVKLVYPYLVGRYEVGGMTLWVSRGTGTWGPRMRLFAPSEILVFTLRSTGAEA
ncbi:MAG TPA: metallophosphoesterase [Elusimicrobiota bacterium]|nr:metallophosphoesterase [Elusimicrobiota bacterium]